MYGIVYCVITLSGQMTGVGGQSIANVKKMLYLCSRVRQSGRTDDTHVIKATEAWHPTACYLWGPRCLRSSRRKHSVGLRREP